MKNKTLVIDRNKWLRGLGGVPSVLLNDDGKMCCLGFYALECGLEKDQLLHNSTPSCLAHSNVDIPDEMAWLLEKNNSYNSEVIKNSDFCTNLMEANDSRHFSSNYRENKIYHLFKEQNIEVTFIN